MDSRRDLVHHEVLAFEALIVLVAFRNTRLSASVTEKSSLQSLCLPRLSFSVRHSESVVLSAHQSVTVPYCAIDPCRSRVAGIAARFPT